MARKRTLILLQIFAYALLRWWFLPIEFTGDSYGYACEVLKGDLLSGHHLLHKYLLSGLYLGWQNSFMLFGNSEINSNPLILFIRFNLIISVLNLVVVWIILENRKWRHSSISLALLLISASFSFIKYSFENETYMLPILLSLIGTLYYERKKWNLAFLFLSVAALFHQIHIFWMISLWLWTPISLKNKIQYLIFSIVLIIGPYLYFAYDYNVKITDLIFQDVQSGLVQLTPTFENFVLTAINFVRVFFQIHGEMIMFWNVFNPFLSGVAIISVLFLLIGVVLYFRAHQLKFRVSDWSKTYLTAFLLQLMFAFYSVGNIEFMISLPFLMILSHHSGRIMNFSLLLSLGMFLWNFGQFALPRTSVSPHRLHQKLQLIESLTPSDQNDVSVCIQDKDFNQNFFEYQKLTKNTRLNIHCTEIDSQESADFILIHNGTRFNRNRFTTNAPNNISSNGKRVYGDSSIMGNIWIITNSNDSH